MLASLRASVQSQVLIRTLLLGLLFQGLGVLAAWLIGLSIGLSVPVSALATTLPLVITLSIGGLGVREGGFVVLLGQAGVSATEATVFSLLNGLAYSSHRHRNAALPHWLSYYNERRSHSSLGDLPPISRVHNVCG